MWSERAGSCQPEDAGTSRSERRSESLLDVIAQSIPYQQVESPEAAANHVLCLSAHSSSAPSNSKVHFSYVGVTSLMTHLVLLAAGVSPGAPIDLFVRFMILKCTSAFLC